MAKPGHDPLTNFLQVHASGGKLALHSPQATTKAERALLRQSTMIRKHSITQKSNPIFNTADHPLLRMQPQPQTP